MSITEELQSHSLYTSIDKYLETLKQVENDEEFLSKLSEYGIQTLNRYTAVINHLKYRLDSIDPFLQRKVTLDSILNESSYLNSMIQSYQLHLTQDGHLNTINNRLDTILANMVSMPQLVDSESVEGIRETVISFRRTVGQHRKRMSTIQDIFTAKKDEINNQVNDLNNSFTEIKNKFETKYNEFESSFSSLEEKIDVSEEQRRQEFNQKIEAYEQSFKEKLNEISEQWEQIQKENEQTIHDTINQLEQEQQNFLDKTEQKQKVYDAILNEHKKSVESLVGIISTNSISGHFKEVADKKEKEVKSWNKTTIGGFLLTIGFGVYAFIIKHEDLTWPSLVARFIVTSALGSFTAYAARQAAKNEVQEKFNRKMEVELKTLNPYIASFSEEDQIKLKEQLFPQIFGRTEGESNAEKAVTHSPTPTNQHDVSNIVTTAIELLKSLTTNNKQ